MDYELKEYTKEYENELIDLLLDICVKEHGLTHYKDRIIEHVKNETIMKRWILLDKSKIIATICYTERNKEIAEIKKVYVKKEYRHQGIGTRLLNMVIHHLKNANYFSTYIGTSDHFKYAREIYEKLGFKFKCYEEDGYLLEMKLREA